MSEKINENNEINENDCIICYETDKNMISLSCKHKFCNDCVKKIPDCALCRKPNTFYENDDNDDDDFDIFNEYNEYDDFHDTTIMYGRLINTLIFLNYPYSRTMFMTIIHPHINPQIIPINIRQPTYYYSRFKTFSYIMGGMIAVGALYLGGFL